MGKSMTTELIKILRKNPSIKVGDLNRQLKKCLSTMSLKRLREIKSTLKKCSADLSPEKQEWKERFTKKGMFEFKGQTSQMHCLVSLSVCGLVRSTCGSDAPGKAPPSARVFSRFLTSYLSHRIA